MTQAEAAKAHNKKGGEYQAQNRLREAESEYKKAIELSPEYEAAYSNLVSVLERQNNIKEARKYVDLSNRLFPDGEFLTLNEAIVLKREKRFEEAAKVLQNRPYPQDPMTHIKVRHELGLIYDRMGLPEKAFPQFQDFNEYAYAAFGIQSDHKQNYLKKIEAYKQTFTPEFVSRFPKPSVATNPPVCVFGFARCGTTLLQHVLDSHPDIYASEEVHAFARIEESLIQNFTTYPKCLADLTENDIQNLRQSYFDIHRADPAFREAKILADKYPMLGSMVGLVHTLFPNGKYVFIQRHPLDVILSCYMQLFAPNETTVHFYDLDDIVALYIAYMDLWEHLVDVLSLDVHIIRYERIVSDFKAEIEPVLRFVGVEWNDELYNYNQNAKKMNVISPSYEQVSETIYTESAYRWVRYKDYLKPYVSKLTPYIEKFGYTD